MRVHVAHSSGQFSDHPEQQVLDAERLSERAFHHNWWWLTGTEGGHKSSLPAGLRKFSDRNHLTFHHSHGDVWIVTNDRHFGHIESEWYPVVPGMGGHFAERGIFRVTGDTELGQISVLTSHFLTERSIKKAHLPGANEQIAHTAGTVAREFGRGKDLVFYGGDQNIQDRKLDTFMGQPFTSLADETGEHQNTGHGEIDVIASYNHDKRVAGVHWKVYDDQEFKLASDHFLCEGVFEIAELRNQ